MARKRSRQPDRPYTPPPPLPAKPIGPPLFDAQEIFQAALATTEARPKITTPEFVANEKQRCAGDPVYFVNQYCQIYDNESASWIPFKLWEFQAQALRDACAVDAAGNYLYPRIVDLKTRQIGDTWLYAVAHKLWKMLFRPISRVLVFSQSDEEAMEILSDNRMKGMYTRLPDWMKQPIKTSNDHEIELESGSGVRALPESRGGDSRTVTDAVIDEADLITDLDNLLARLEPTLGSKGQLIIIGRAVKERPNSPFKRLYNLAKANEVKGEGKWKKVHFIPWFAHPGRTKDWYDQLCRDTLTRTGSLDFVHEHYPATDVEALQARTLDKRFPPQWLTQVYQERRPIDWLPPTAPIIIGLRIYILPEAGRTYVLGADPAEGNPRSDDSVIHVVDADSKQQCATLQNKIEPSLFAADIAALSVFYNNAPVMPERNNHGHEVIATLRKDYSTVPILNGEDGKAGWLTLRRTQRTGVVVGSKVKMYDIAVKVIQEHLANAAESGDTPYPLFFDAETVAQVSSIDASTLSAPENMHDDLSIGWALAQVGAYRSVSSMVQARHDLYSERAPIPGTSIKARERGKFPPAFENEAAIWDKLRRRGIK